MRLYKLLENGNFASWFGNSVVVDTNGDPLVVYHGTGADIGVFKGMVWASVGTELPTEYAYMRQEYNDGNANVVPLYMRVEHPFNADHLPKAVTIGDVFNEMLEQTTADLSTVSDKFKENWDIVERSRREEGSGPHYNRQDFWNNASSLFGTTGASAVYENFKLCGFDGIRMIENGELTFGAFSSNQVKSIYNSGGYDPENPHISETISV